MNDKKILNVDFPFIRKTGEQVTVYTPNMIMWYIKTGDHIPVKKLGGIVEYEEETIAITWEKLIKEFKPVSSEAKVALTYVLNKILTTYQEKIDDTRKYLAEIA